MKFRFSNMKPSLAMLGALAALVVTGCGDDGSAPATPASEDGGTQVAPDGGGGGGGDESTTEGETTTTEPANTSEPNGNTSEPGNTSTDGETEPNPTTEGDGGATTAPSGDGGTEPPPAGGGNVDDLIAAICDWEFRCCDDGERKFRFGPSITDAATCKERFVHELRESNSTKNPFVGGPAAGGLLASLAYAINLSRVDVNSEAVSACTEQWNALECNKPAPDEVEACTATDSEVTNPCALNELFEPKLEQDATCTPSLGQSGTNDIECVPGTSCLAADDPANGNGVPSCIKRSVVDEPCTDDVDCDFGLYCDGSSCAAKGDLGDECTYEDDEGTGNHPNSCKPGLSCDPDSKECVAACSAGYECLTDFQCPEGLSCAPVYTDDDELFHVCRNLGSKITDQCDNEDDCVENQYCNKGAEDTIGNCASDKNVDEDCTGVAGECEEGTFCNLTEGTCKAYNTPDEQCTRADADNGVAQPKDFPECSPTTEGCFPRYNEEAVAVEYFCRSAKNANGSDCWVNADCQSGKCEIDDDADPYLYRTGFICTAGLDVGEDCADHSCKAGTVCDPVEIKCVEQIAPGANCENPETEEADTYLCANSVCAEQWDMLICSDAPVPASAGGSGVSCDGNE